MVESFSDGETWSGLILVLITDKTSDVLRVTDIVTDLLFREVFINILLTYRILCLK